MFKKILVPLDGSELAEHALDPAFTFARQTQGEIILLRVPLMQHVLAAEPVHYEMPSPSESLEQSRQKALTYLAGIQRVRSSPQVTIHACTPLGDPAGNIVDTAVAEDVDLIVMTTHGYSGVTRWLLGSVTEKVLRHAHCPVLVIRSNKPLGKVLIPVDGSKLSESAVLPGLEVANRLDALATLLRVAEEIETQGADSADFHWQQEIYEDNEFYLRTLVNRYQQEGQYIDTAVMEGPPVDRILEFVESEEIDVIALATHGRSGLQRWVYGSVTEKLLRSANCAMLIIRPMADEFED